MKKFGEKFRFAILYCTYLLSFVLLIVYFVSWRPFVNGLRKAGKYEVTPSKHVDSKAIRRLGDVRTAKKSSFINFAQAKGMDVIRIGAFGDSFTYGDEVGETHDFPTFLQQFFDDQGINNVEVINFGSSWHGFHQAYIMWDSVGRNFSCDYIILGPACFQAKRDTSFNHTDLSEPYFFHARYIIDNTAVRMVEVLGETAEERFDHYFRFIPRWRYLRYDRNPPPLLQAMLPKGRTIKNIFYYHSDSMKQEAYETYTRLLSKLSDQDVQVVLAHKSGKIIGLGKQVDKKNLAVKKLYTTRKFPYAAPKNHFSAWGNQIIAEQIYKQIIAEQDNTITLLQTSDITAAISSPSASEKAELSSYDRIEVSLNGTPVGFFVVVSLSLAERGKGSPEGLKDTGITSFLAIKNRGDSLLDACFVPLDHELGLDDKVILRIHAHLNSKDYLLGTIRYIDELLNIAVVDVDGIEFVKLNKLCFVGNEQISQEQLLEKGNTTTILIRDKAILKGTQENNCIILNPESGVLRRIRANTSGFVDLQNLPDAGYFSLHLQHADHGTRNIPIARWEKMILDTPRAERPIQKILTQNGSHKVVMRQRDSQR